MSKEDFTLQTNGYTNGNNFFRKRGENRLERLKALLGEVQKEIALEKEDKHKKIYAATKNVVNEKIRLVRGKMYKEIIHILLKERSSILQKKKLLESRLRFQEKTIAKQKEALKMQEHMLDDYKGQLQKTFDSSEILQLVEPTLLKSTNPLKSIRYYLEYRKQKKRYQNGVARIATSDFSLTVTGSNRGTHTIDYLREYDRFLKVGEKWVRMYYLYDIPSELTPYIQFKLLASELPFSASLFVEPTPSNILLKKARQRISILEAKQQQREQKGLTRDPHIDRGITETKLFAEDLVYERERGLIYSYYLKLEAGTKEELDRLHKEFKNLAENMEVVFNTYAFGQKQAFKNSMPFGKDAIREDRIIQSSAGSYLMPFVAKPLYNPKGIFIGTNVYHNSLVFLHPFTTEITENNNINIFGVSGAGKSVTSKILASRMYMQGTQIIIVDPEGEYVKLARTIGGEIIQFSRDNGINPFSLAGSERSHILDHITMLKTFFKFFVPEDKFESAVLDKVLVLLYKNYPKEKPTFNTFLTRIKNTRMYEDLAILNNGSLQGIFDAKRDLQLSSDFIVFDLKALSENEVKRPAMYLLTFLIWQLVNTISERQRMLFIDEAHILLKDDETAKDYQRLVKQARKRNLGVVSITQDVEDFLLHPLGKAIINNSATKILLKQSYAALGLMGNIFPMTDEEKLNLGSLKKGEVIIFRGNDQAATYVSVLPSEAKLVL